MNLWYYLVKKQGIIMVTKGEIKEAAFQLFALEGYEATSTSEIGKMVGLTKQSLYSHFNSKSELYVAVLRDKFTIIYGALEEAFLRLKDETDQEVLKGIFECIIKVFSYRELLLLWKRTFVTYSSGEKALIDQIDWQFDRYIYQKLYERFHHNEQLNTPESFQPFFIYYMLTIQGYMDWMLIKPHSSADFQNVWHGYWTANEHYFKA